jgi:hypothetical protein
VPRPAYFPSLDAWLAAVLARLRNEGIAAGFCGDVGLLLQPGTATERGEHGLTAREYVEAIAEELGRARGGGLLLSPADAQLALGWHASDVPLATVLAAVRKAGRLRAHTTVRGAVQTALCLQVIAPALERIRARRQPPVPATEGLGAQLRAAAEAPELAARAAWHSLAERAEQLLAEEGGDGYWTAAVGALKAALRELPRSAALQAGSALRARIAPRPPAMSRRRYQRSLQLMLLSASSERLGVPPRAFLL